MRRILRTLVAAGVIVAATVSVQLGTRAGATPTAVAINTKDGSAVFRFAFHVHRTMSDVVDSTNAAVAFASCEECQTVAVAIQVVLVMSDPSIVTPTNLALAVNQQCSACETLASAYQYVVSTDGPVHFDADGNRELAAIRIAFRDLIRDSEQFDAFAIQTQVDGLVDRLYAVVDGHLVPAGPLKDLEEGSDQPSTAVTPTEPTASPESSSEPTPEDEPTTSPSPAPTEEQTPEPTPTES
jgi:putative peptide zinc metalloprotease protein